MSNNPSNQKYAQEHYVVETATPKWIVTGLTTIGAALVGGLLLWIAKGQFTTAVEQGKMAVQMNNLIRIVEDNNHSVNDNLITLRQNQDRIWPRLRSHGENIAILRHELEQLCNCEIVLEEPETY